MQIRPVLASECPQRRLVRTPEHWLKDEPDTLDGVEGPATLSKLLPQSDVAAYDVPPSLSPEPFDIFGDSAPAELSAPPPGSLPDVIERWAVSEARRRGVPVAFAAAAAIGTCAGAIGGSATIWVRRHDTKYVEPASLWLCLAAPSGSAKSPTISAALAPLREMDIAWWREGQAKRVAWEEVQRSAKKGQPAPASPKERRLVVDDVTTR